MTDEEAEPEEDAHVAETDDLLEGQVETFSENDETPGEIYHAAEFDDE